MARRGLRRTATRWRLPSILNRKLAGSRCRPAVGKAMLAKEWPIAQMMEHVCCTADLAEKKKDNEETEAKG